MVFSPVILPQKILGLEVKSLGSLKIQHRDGDREQEHWWQHVGGNFEVESKEVLKQ